MDEKKLCRRCVLPESPPEITFDETGLCNLCADYEKNKPAQADKLFETDFTKLLAKNAGKGEYDCLVMCSGGKDSTAALYYMVKRYKVRALAYTFDHGFETEDAMANVRRAVEKLGVDFLFFRSTFMDDAFRKILETGSKAVICHLCSIWYMQLSYKMAERFNIPVIIAGWTKGQTGRQQVLSKCACSVSEPEYKRMGEATAEFIKSHMRNDPKYSGMALSMEEVIARAAKTHKCLVLSPHWFLPYDSSEYVQVIEKELGWKYPALSYPAKSTNCYLNFIAAHNSMKYYGYTHYHVEMSKLIRQGLMTRAEALELLKSDFGGELLDKIAARLGCKVK